MFVIGITGGIGCGKSSVAMLCREAGLYVIDADQISHTVTAAQGSATPAIINAFGSAYLSPDGSLDRAKLAKLVFNDKKKLDTLSYIVHAEVIKEIALQIDGQLARGNKLCVVDVPIPVKHGFLDRCDQVWCVWAEEEIRLSRLEARGMPRPEALRRIALQMSKAEYEALADIVIDNSADFDSLRKKVNSLFEQELAIRGLSYRAI